MVLDGKGIFRHFFGKFYGIFNYLYLIRQQENDGWKEFNKAKQMYAKDPDETGKWVKHKIYFLFVIMTFTEIAPVQVSNGNDLSSNIVVQSV